MRAAAERGATLTSHLLAFARRQPLLPRAVDLNALVAGMQDLLHSALGRAVQIETRLAPDLWPAMVDPTQIELVVLNLAINARDAMPRWRRGHRGDRERATRRRRTAAGEPAEGDYVAITVRDVGTGMTPEVQARAFEPFFTTKGPGAGSGLGLSQVFGTARQSGGGVRIDSAPGEGTAVTRLPAPRGVAGRACRQPLFDDTLRAAHQRRRRTRVDDDDAVRLTTAEILQPVSATTWCRRPAARRALELLRPERHHRGAADRCRHARHERTRSRPARPGCRTRFCRSCSSPATPTLTASPATDARTVWSESRSSPSDLRRQIEAALAEARISATPPTPA